MVPNIHAYLRQETTVPRGPAIHVVDDVLDDGIGADGDIAILRTATDVTLHRKAAKAWETPGRSLTGDRGTPGVDGKPTLRVFADRAALDSQKVASSDPLLPAELVEVASYDGARALVRCDYDPGPPAAWTDRVFTATGAAPSELVAAIDRELGTGWKDMGDRTIAVSATISSVANGDYDLTGLMPVDASLDEIQVSMLGAGSANLELVLATADMATVWPLGDLAAWPVAISGALTEIDLTTIATNRHVFGRDGTAGEPRRLIARFSNLVDVIGDVDVLVAGVGDTPVAPTVEYPTWAFEQDFDALADGTVEAGSSGLTRAGSPQVGTAYGRTGKGVRCATITGAERIHYAFTDGSEVWGQVSFRLASGVSRTFPLKIAFTRPSTARGNVFSVRITPSDEIEIADFATSAPTLNSTFTVVDDVWHTLKYGIRLSATPAERAFYLAVQADGGEETILFDGVHTDTDAPGEMVRWAVGCMPNGAESTAQPIDFDDYQVAFARPIGFLPGLEE